MNPKKQQLDSSRPLSSDLVKSLDDWLKVELTYTSNAIEGNTLSRAETAQIILDTKRRHSNLAEIKKSRK